MVFLVTARKFYIFSGPMVCKTLWFTAQYLFTAVAQKPALFCVLWSIIYRISSLGKILLNMGLTATSSNGNAYSREWLNAHFCRVIILSSLCACFILEQRFTVCHQQGLHFNIIVKRQPGLHGIWRECTLNGQLLLSSMQKYFEQLKNVTCLGHYSTLWGSKFLWKNVQ